MPTGNIFKDFIASLAIPIKVAQAIRDQTHVEGMTPKAMKLLEAAVGGAKAAGLDKIEITAAKGGGHLSHASGTEWDIVGRNADGSMWNNDQRVAVAEAARRGGADRFGLYDMEKGLGAGTLHFGYSGEGRPAAVWGAGGNTSGSKAVQFSDPASINFYRSYANNKPYPLPGEGKGGVASTPSPATAPKPNLRGVAPAASAPPQVDATIPPRPRQRPGYLSPRLRPGDNTPFPRPSPKRPADAPAVVGGPGELGITTGPKRPPGTPNEAGGAPPIRDDLKLTPQELNLYNHHLDELNKGGVENPDGSISTLKQITVEVDGQHYNIPTIWDGKEVSTEEAIKRAEEKGWDYWPNYHSDEAAQYRYNQMHEYMDKELGFAPDGGSDTAPPPSSGGGEPQTTTEDVQFPDIKDERLTDVLDVPPPIPPGDTPFAKGVTLGDLFSPSGGYDTPKLDPIPDPVPVEYPATQITFVPAVQTGAVQRLRQIIPQGPRFFDWTKPQSS